MSSFLNPASTQNVLNLQAHKMISFLTPASTQNVFKSANTQNDKTFNTSQHFMILQNDKTFNTSQHFIILQNDRIFNWVTLHLLSICELQPTLICAGTR